MTRPRTSIPVQKLKTPTGPRPAAAPLHPCIEPPSLRALPQDMTHKRFSSPTLTLLARINLPQVLPHQHHTVAVRCRHGTPKYIPCILEVWTHLYLTSFFFLLIRLASRLNLASLLYCFRTTIKLSSHYIRSPTPAIPRYPTSPFSLPAAERLLACIHAINPLSLSYPGTEPTQRY